jgi:hypothetical protein
MRHARRTIWICGWLSLSLAVTAQAQSGATAVSPPDSVTPSPDSAPAEGKKKKGGLFGKVKGLAGNKVVQSVAKTAACTMVPGGQVIAGAIDAASSKGVGEAAAGAAGAAGGQTCVPGGIGGMGAGAAGAVGGMPGMAGAAGGLEAAGLAGAVVGGVGLPGAAALPLGAMPEDAMGYGAMPGAPAPKEIAGCMGLSVEEYLDFTDPTRGQPRPVTKEEMERQGALAKKVDMGRYQACMMQQYSTRMSATSQTMVQTSAPSPGDAVADGDLSEAPGKTVSVSSDPAADLAKGRTVVKDIDWLAGGGEVSEAGAAAFTDAIAKLAVAISKAGGHYRADIYLDKRYEDVAIATLGSARLKVVQAALEGAGVQPGVVTSGKAKKDKNPRLEIVKAKK